MTKDREEKGVIDFTATDAEYSAKIAGAKARRAVPLGGAAMPSIPRFDQAPPDPHLGVQARDSLHRVLSPEQQAEMASRGGFVPGVGSAYAINQPPVRQEQPAPDASSPGKFVNPPRPEGAGLRPATVEGLQAVARANTETPDPANADLKQDFDEIDEMDAEFDTDEFGNRVRSLLRNRARREAIEKRCEPMSFDSLLLHNEVRQMVPIIPRKFEPTYRSVGGHEDLYIKRRMSTVKGSPQFIMDMFAILGLTAGLFALNGKPLISHLDKDGEVDDNAFEAKYKHVLRMSWHLLADLSVNHIWFGRRVEKLFVVDEIKGF